MLSFTRLVLVEWMEKELVNTLSLWVHCECLMQLSPSFISDEDVKTVIINTANNWVQFILSYVLFWLHRMLWWLKIRSYLFTYLSVCLSSLLINLFIHFISPSTSPSQLPLTQSVFHPPPFLLWEGGEYPPTLEHQASTGLDSNAWSIEWYSKIYRRHPCLRHNIIKKSCWIKLNCKEDLVMW